MGENTDNTEIKSWWESQLDWTLPDSVQDTLDAGGRLLRNIPATLSAYRLGKTSPMDHLNPDPVEKITNKNLKKATNNEQSQKIKKASSHLLTNEQSQRLNKPALTPPSNEQPQKNTRPLPRIMPPPPKPSALLKREEEARALRDNVGKVTAEQPALAPVADPVNIRAIDISAMSATVVSRAYGQCSSAPTEPKPSSSVPGTSVPTKPTVQTDEERAQVTSRVVETVERKHLTLEQLLDPDFCEYTS